MTVIRKLFDAGRSAAIMVTAAFLALACSLDHAGQSWTDTRAGLHDLPLITASAAQPQALAIVLSGDGGWQPIEQRITADLTRANIGVVGLDSLEYFWVAKTPECLAADLERIVAYYTAAWHVDDVLLVGYSFGADVLPAAVNRMKAADRDLVAQISLLGLSTEAAFEFHAADWLGIGSSGTQPIMPEAEKLDMTKVQCVYGERERDSLCRHAVFQGAELIEIPGGHHFDGDYESLARRILGGYRARISS